MKKKWIYLWPVFAILVCCIISCNKAGPAENGTPDADTQLIHEAMNLFWSAYHADSSDYPWTARNCQPLWDKASVATLSTGKAVVVPVAVQGPLSLRIGSRQIPLTASQVTWLLIYQDSAQRWQIERIIRIPYAETTDPVPFTGKVRVEDWHGHFLRGFLYTPGAILALTHSRTYLRTGHRGEPLSEIDEPPPAGGPLPAAPILVAPPAAAPLPPPDAVIPLLANPTAPKPTETCTETDWYACSTIGDGPTQCDYAYTTEECTGSAGSGPVSSGPPGTPSGADYLLVGVPIGGPTASGAAIQSIKPDTSITNHPLVLCVYTHLMNPNLNHGLKSILASFDDNQVYNITFALSPGLTTDDGECSYLGNNAFLITLNAGEAEDSDYSRIYLASTFIHEAFHAKLRQKALETFGEASISTWPKPIDDMTLAELATYFEAESKSANIWESVEHDWMVDNIATLATSLEQFVQTYYKATYASVGSDLAPYEALMYMGLQDATIYQEEVVGKGLESSVEAAWGDLNEGGKCQD